MRRILLPLVVLCSVAFAAPALAGGGRTKARRETTARKSSRSETRRARQKTRTRRRGTRPRSYLTERGTKSLVSRSLKRRQPTADWHVTLHRIWPALGKREARQTFTALDRNKQNGEPGRMMSGYINVQRRSETKGTDRVKAHYQKQRYPTGEPVLPPSRRN